MGPFDWLLLIIGVCVVLWYVGWFGTYWGSRKINGFSDEQFKIFVIFNVSLIIAFALIGIYFIKRLGVFE